MKKVIKSVIIMASLFVGFSTVTKADGAITEIENQILVELNKGMITAEGQTVHFEPSDIAQAENELKARNVEKVAVDKILGNIQSGRAIVLENSKGIRATSMGNLVSQLDVTTRNSLQALVRDSLLAVDLSLNSDGQIVENGKPVYSPTSVKPNGTVTAAPVKPTGANNMVSVFAFVSIVVVALGATIIGRRYALV